MHTKPADVHRGIAVVKADWVALVPGWSLRILMDLFHDLGSVRYVKSRDSTEQIEKKKKEYIQFLLSQNT